MVTVQTLSELEEAMQYKLIAERRPIISQMWWTRLRVRSKFLFEKQFFMKFFSAGLPGQRGRLAEIVASTIVGVDTARNAKNVDKIRVFM